MVTITALGESRINACECHPRLPALGAHDDPDRFCTPGLFDHREPTAQECIAADFLCNTVSGDRARSPVLPWTGQCLSGGRRRFHKSISGAFVARAAASCTRVPAPGWVPVLPVCNRTSMPSPSGMFPWQDKVDVLNSGDKSHGFFVQEREGICQYGSIKVDRVWFKK